MELSKIDQYENLDPKFIKNKVASEIFEIISGNQLMQYYWNRIHEIRFNAMQKENREREIVAISRSKAIPPYHGTISELLQATSFFSSEQALKNINFQANALAEDIKIRGDKRISNPQKTAIDFYQSIIDLRQGISEKSAKEQILEIFFNQGIDLMALPQNWKISKVLEILEVRRKIKAVASSYSIVYSDKFISLITPQTLPSMAISYGLKKYGQDQKERKGSELNDRYIAGYSPYVDLFYADKRTANDFVQLNHKDSITSSLVKCFKKTCTLSEIIKDVQLIKNC